LFLKSTGKVKFFASFLRERYNYSLFSPLSFAQFCSQKTQIALAFFAFFDHNTNNTVVGQSPIFFDESPIFDAILEFSSSMRYNKGVLHRTVQDTNKLGGKL